MMNLHATVRGPITTVVPDIAATWQQSAGYAANAAGARTPTYAAPVAVTVQVQPLSKQELTHTDFLNIEGVYRSVYLYQNAQGVDRPNVQGGDLLAFPQVPGATPQVWLVVNNSENFQGVGWTRVIVCLQTDVVIN